MPPAVAAARSTCRQSHGVVPRALPFGIPARSDPRGMNLPGWGLHPLKGKDLKGHYSLTVNGNWRMTFTFEGVDTVLVDYQDYH